MHECRVWLQPDLVARVELMTFAEYGDDLLAAELGEHLRFRTGRLDDHDLGFDALIGKLEMLRPNAVDHGAAFDVAGADASGSAAPVTVLTEAEPFTASVPSRKFIAGEPMKPATNWLVGGS